ncbi:MAG: RNA ligase, Rnl2 family [Candidatus Hodarchaeota archaeon]
MVAFSKYSSIENSYRKEFIERIHHAGRADQQYVIEEKVHGANLSFWVTRTDLKVAKRTDFLAPDENFYNYQSIVTKYQAHTRQLFDLSQEWVKKRHIGTAVLVVIYGELFGGSYPHVDVPSDPNAKRVAKGVDYSPVNDYYTFDVRITTDDEKHHYPDVFTRNQLLEQAGFFYARPLFTGTLTECLDYPITFDTLIPQWLGLPLIEGNLCEGVVIKPVETTFLPNGKRIILKRKNDNFAERKLRVKKHTDSSTQSLSPHIQEIINIANEYVTKTRYANLLTKYGQFSEQEFGKLVGLYIKDLLEDFTKDHGESFMGLPKNERKQITKRLSRIVPRTLRKYMEEEKM